jgi:hypothetical protein
VTGPPGFEPRPHITEAEFFAAIQRVLLDEWHQLVAAGYLTEQGLLAVRSRLIHGGEFTRDANRHLLLLQVRDAYAAAKGIEPDDIPIDDELAVPDDASEFDEPPES